MAPRTARARDIFLDAVEIGSPEPRSAFLEEACAGNDELRRRVEALIEAHEHPDSLLDRAAVDPGTTDALEIGVVTPITDGPGTMIGPYKLLEQIGEGAWVRSTWPSKSSRSAGRWR
jgi:hypothetical protein